MNRQLTRRRFLKQSAFAGITILVAPGVARTYAANEQLDVACIGAGGAAGGSIRAALGQNVVAVAEVDMGGRARGNIERVRSQAPQAKFYTDFRRLFEAHPKLDAVFIGTPDHTHFSAAMMAMEGGAGVFCEKPLSWSVWESRKLAETAAQKKLPTQMGNQGNASESIRRLCEYVWAGALGDVTRVDCISNRRFSAGDERPEPTDPPREMDWDAWLGPAPHRDFHEGLHPFRWRGWLDFGTGSIGDMGPHTADGAVWALKLDEAPRVEVEAEKGKPTAQGHPPQAIVRYKFPARRQMPPVVLTWYHGGLLPPRPEQLEEGRRQLTEGAYYHGSKNVAMTGSHAGSFRIIPEQRHREVEVPEPTLPRSPHGIRGDLIAACRNPDKVKPSSHFGYSGRLTEILLLGNIACISGERFTYDFETGRSNSDKADALLQRQSRKGWEFGYE